MLAPRHGRRVMIGTMLFWFLASCGGGSPDTTVLDICDCTPGSPFDYRHAAKHVPVPSGTPIEITVADMLTWAQTPVPPSDAPRTGRELQLFHIATAYVRSAHVFIGDCDLVMEVSDTPDASAPRVVVETPIESEHCPARRNIQAQLAAHGYVLSTQIKEVVPPLAVEVLGLAFQDFPHDRGGPLVATVWELHPAAVSALTTP